METNITITPGSGGPNVDLEQVDNGNVRQVICIGDPLKGANVAPVDPVAGMMVAQLANLNRTRLVLSANAVLSVVAEALMPFQSYRAGVVVAGITSYTVPAGKTLRLQNIVVKIRPSVPSTTVTFASTVLNLREGNTIASPLIASFPILMQTNMDSNPTVVELPGGLEFPAGTVLSISHLASAATILEAFNLFGFEY